MPRIVFFCPPVTVINGGIKYIFRMAETLIALGYDACVFEQNEQRPAWISSTAPVVGQSIFTPDADNIYVLPEDQPHILKQFSQFPQKKVIYSQNHFYGAIGIGDAGSYADYGISHVICSSRTIYDHCRVRHPAVKTHLVPYAINRDLFKPAPAKQNSIAYMPRKRAIEAIYIRDMFRFTFPQYRDWTWRELSGLSETEVAKTMGESKIFLSLSRLEGFGLTPLEAMSSGCVVAGFTGIGGREYATGQNGFWAGEDDFPVCVQQLGKAVTLSLDTGSARATYTQNAEKTLTPYTPEAFKTEVKQAWSGILAN